MISQKSSNSQLNIDECPICLDKRADLLLVCSHKFCSTCIQAALKKHNFCPLCRKYDPLNRKTPGDEKPQKVPCQDQWNVQVARRAILKKVQNGMNKVFLVDQNGKEESTNVFIGDNAKIIANPSANIYINGKKVNPNDCNHQ